jgi:hypothetical protein
MQGTYYRQLLVWQSSSMKGQLREFQNLSGQTAGTLIFFVKTEHHQKLARTCKYLQGQMVQTCAQDRLARGQGVNGRALLSVHARTDGAEVCTSPC